MTQVFVTPASSGRDMDAFIRFPLRHYGQDPLFVPHLLYERKKFFSRSNPIFQFTEVVYLLARDEQGKVLGRVTAHINERHNRHAGEKTGFFGFFECVDDEAAASALMKAAEDTLRARGMKMIRGPFNFSTNEECGFLVQGFDRAPSFMMPYTKPYYPDLMTRLGYNKARDLLAYEYEYKGSIPEHLVRFSERIRERKKVVIRPIHMQRFAEDVETIFRIYNDAWSQNWGFVPVTEEEFRATAKDLKPIVDPSIVLIAEKESRPVGFIVTLPDYNVLLKKMGGRLFPFGFLHLLFGRKSVTRVRTLLMGVVADHRLSGIEVLLIHDTFERGLPKGYRGGEMSWILEDNVLMRRAVERMGATIGKVYRIYEKTL
ncbi:MAG: N-acetyltransferase [Deltaproteobacteria bacterium]|jgi:GNAT superfamily N-acetyltransferase|nr:N-acetyltransferase [Deltaproteobacteria bacterium]